MPSRLAIIVSHPVQYYSPWFRHLSERPELEIKVFYLWDFGVKETRDRSFETTFVWDIPLLDGYESEFVPNRNPNPGTHHFRGLDNPGVVGKVLEWQPDAVLLFGYSYATHLRLILSFRLARVPFLFRGDSHELCPALGWKPRVSRLLRGLLFRRFYGFLAVGHANAGYFQTGGISVSKVYRVPHCVDNDRFQSAAIEAEAAASEWKRELGIPADSTIVLFAGKFEKKKRPLDLLEAFLNLKRRIASENDMTEETGSYTQLPSSNRQRLSVLLFIGSGPLESSLREIAGNATGRSVFFAPFQNQLAMPKVYATADVLVLPSFGRGETWGLAVNEAMNLAKPAIVSSHVGCGPDLIVEGETGWIFPAGNVDALRRTLVKALTDPEQLKRMGVCAKAHIANYSYDRATESFLKVMNKIERLEAKNR